LVITFDEFPNITPDLAIKFGVQEKRSDRRNFSLIGFPIRKGSRRLRFSFFPFTCQRTRRTRRRPALTQKGFEPTIDLSPTEAGSQIRSVFKRHERDAKATAERRGVVPS
jgi:hypothetical protein